MNLMQLIQMMGSANNPEQMMMSFLEQNAQNDPKSQKLLALVKSGKPGSVEEFVKNYVNSQGGDFDKEFGTFKKMFHIK